MRTVLFSSPLQRQKLKHREVIRLTQVKELVVGKAGSSAQAIQLQTQHFNPLMRWLTYVDIAQPTPMNNQKLMETSARVVSPYLLPRDTAEENGIFQWYILGL